MNEEQVAERWNSHPRVSLPHGNMRDTRCITCLHVVLPAKFTLALFFVPVIKGGPNGGKNNENKNELKRTDFRFS